MGGDAIEGECRRNATASDATTRRPPFKVSAITSNPPFNVPRMASSPTSTRSKEIEPVDDRRHTILPPISP
jgi:tRNA1(Val) A37 N6-methylase TrmN6